MRRNTDPTVRLMAALADPVRLDIVRQLSLGEDVCACDFDVHPKLTQPTVSHHLRVLRAAGVVRVERRGTFVHYSLEPAAVERLAALVRSLRPPALMVSTPGTGQWLPARAVAAEARVRSGRQRRAEHGPLGGSHAIWPAEEGPLDP